MTKRMRELLETWINGNRKAVAEELCTRPHADIFWFVLKLHKQDPADVGRLAKLMDLYRDGYEKSTDDEPASLRPGD